MNVRTFDEWKKQIKEYCDLNSLDFQKLENLSKCWNKDMIVFQKFDSQKGKRGLYDDTPAPAVLIVERGKNGDLIFEQTEYTRNYLAY